MSIVRKLVPESIKDGVNALKSTARVFGGLGSNPIMRAMIDVRAQMHSAPLPTSESAPGIAGRIKDAFRSPAQIPSAYRVGGIWEIEFRKNKPRYSAALSGSNAQLADVLQSFRRNDAGVGIDLSFRDWQILSRDPIRFFAFATHLITKFQAVQRFLAPAIVTAATDSLVGQPIFLPFEGARLTLNAIRHACYADEILKLKPLTVLELGGGYGNLARIVKTCLPKVTYAIVDLPQTLTIASYFLLENFPNAKIALNPPDLSDLGQWDFVLLPNWRIEDVPGESIDVFVNTGSLVEMDLDIVQNYLRQARRLVREDGYFYSVNRASGITYSYSDVPEVGMDQWDIDRTAWKELVMRPSWADQHWGAWENLNYVESVLIRSTANHRT